MLIEGCPLDHVRFQTIVDERDEFEGQCPEDGGRRDAVSEEIIEFGSDLEDALRGVFFDYLLGDLGD